MEVKRYIAIIMAVFAFTCIYAQDSTTTAIMLNAVKEYNDGNYTKAADSFKKLAAIQPGNDAAYYYLANISIKGDDMASGELYLKKCIRLDSTNYWYRDMLGQIYLKNNKIKEAIGVYEKLLELYPKKSAVYYNLINLYLGAQETINARKILEKIEGVQGKSEAVAMTYFNIYRMEQNWDGALEYLIEFDKEYQSPRIETIIGDMLADRFKDSLAIEYYNKALAIDQQFAPAMYSRAEVHRMKGRYDQFFADITPFISNPATDPNMKIEYLKQIFQVPNFTRRFRPQMDSLMTGMEKAHPADTTSNMFVASYWGQGGENEKCKALLKKNYDLYPDNFNMLFQYLIAIYQLEEWENLEQAAIEAMGKYPKHPDFVQLAGISRFRLKKYDKAIESYKEMASIAQSTKDTASLITANSILGDLYYEMKDSKNAFAHYKKVLKLNPNEIPALNNYAYYLSEERKSLKKAYQMSKKTIEAEPDNPTYLYTFGWILFLMDKPVEAQAQFKHAMLYGGTENANILDHYAEVLFKLGEHDLAFIYWDQAKQLDNTLNIEEKIKERKAMLKQRGK